jgi:hypothetical protein
MADPTVPNAYPESVLGVMSCQLALRPAGAPHFADLAPALRDVRRDGAALVVSYDDRASSTLAEVVAADRLCCPGIGWSLEDDGATLRVTAAPEQLDLIEQLVRLGAGAF